MSNDDVGALIVPAATAVDAMPLAAPRANASVSVVSVSAPTMRSPLDECTSLHAQHQQSPVDATTTTCVRPDDVDHNDDAAAKSPPLPLAPSKRRATSFQDRLPRHSPPKNARNAMATAFATMSSATTERFAKFRSLSSDTFLKKSKPTPVPPASASAPTASTTTSTTNNTALPPLPLLSRTGSWKANVNGLARRAKEVAKRAKSSSRTYAWDLEGPSAPLTVSRTFEYHSEDAGAAAPYYHIVADGVSSPFGRNSLALANHEPVSSELIATALVRAIEQALVDITNANQSCIDVKTFESVVVDAIAATRIALFAHRQSRIATTLTVAYFDRWHGRLLTFALGDSKCIVVRRGAVVFETMAVLRDFNMPTVVNLSAPLARTDYALEAFALEARDIVLTFSDGIGDNLYKDDITGAVDAAVARESSASGGVLSLPVLQTLCDELVCQSQMKISVERAQELLALATAHDDDDGDGDSSTSDSSRGSGVDDVEPEPPVRISVHSAPVRGLFPFATAAAIEYRARALAECAPSSSSTDKRTSRRSGHSHNKPVDHLARSLALFEKHSAKRTLDRHVLVPRPASRKRHYNLVQLQRMAEMQTKKPDDITLFISQFR